MTKKQAFENIEINLTDEEAIAVLDLYITQNARPCTVHLFNELKNTLSDEQKKNLDEWKNLVYVVYMNEMVNSILETQIAKLEKEKALEKNKKATKTKKSQK